MTVYIFIIIVIYNWIIIYTSFRFRFSYPTELYDKMKVFLSDNGVGNDLMVDIACGSGQSTFPLSPVFKRCIGTDISEAQISYAKEKIDKHTPNVEFEVSSSDKLSFPDQSVDMISCAQAWHWLDHSTTIPEVQRVLKKPGCVAIYGYSRPILANKTLNVLFNEFCECYIFQYRHPRSQPLDNLYHDIPLPYPLTERYDTTVHYQTTIQDFIGYISTWSSWQRYLEHHSKSAIENLDSKMRDSLKNEGANNKEQIAISCSVFALLCVC